MLKPEYRNLFQSLIGSGSGLALSGQEVQEILSSTLNGLSEERRQVVLTAYQLLGKVHYFCGGNVQIIHCASGSDNVVVTEKIGFKTRARPKYYS